MGVYRINRTNNTVGRINSRRVSAGAELLNFFNQSYAGNRTNSIGYTLGFEMTMLEDVTIKAIGRQISTAITVNHSVGIWRVSDTSLISSVVITPTSPVDSLDYSYELLLSPITLESGEVYRIGSYEQTDLCRERSELPNHLGVASIDEAYYSSPWSFTMPTISAGAGKGYVPPTFFI